MWLHAVLLEGAGWNVLGTESVCLLNVLSGVWLGTVCVLLNFNTLIYIAGWDVA